MVRVAIISTHGHANVRRHNTLCAVDGGVHWTNNRWSGGILYHDRLYTSKAGIATSVLCHPGAGNSIVIFGAGAITDLGAGIVRCLHWVGIAIVRTDRHAQISRRSIFRTVDGGISRTNNGWSGGIGHSDGLHQFGGPSIAILQPPGTLNCSCSTTASQHEYIIKSRIKSCTTSVHNVRNIACQRGV